MKNKVKTTMSTGDNFERFNSEREAWLDSMISGKRFF